MKISFWWQNSTDFVTRKRLVGWLLLAREGDDALVQPQALTAPWRPEPLCDAAAEGRLPDLRRGAEGDARWEWCNFWIKIFGSYFKKTFLSQNFDWIWDGFGTPLWATVIFHGKSGSRKNGSSYEDHLSLTGQKFACWGHQVPKCVHHNLSGW